MRLALRSRWRASTGVRPRQRHSGARCQWIRCWHICNVPYIMVYENTIKKPNWLLQQVLRRFVKGKVVLFYKHLDHHLTQFGV